MKELIFKMVNTVMISIEILLKGLFVLGFLGAGYYLICNGMSYFDYSGYHEGDWIMGILIGMVYVLFGGPLFVLIWRALSR